MIFFVPDFCSELQIEMSRCPHHLSWLSPIRLKCNTPRWFYYPQACPPPPVTPPLNHPSFRYPTLPSTSLTPPWNPTSYPPSYLSNLLTSVRLPCCCPSSGHHRSFLHCRSWETPFCLKPCLPTVCVPRASQGNLSKNGNMLSLSCLLKPWTMSLCQMASSVTLSPANSLPFTFLIMCYLIH